MMAPHSFMHISFLLFALTHLLTFATPSPLLVHQVEELASNIPTAKRSLQRRQETVVQVTGISEFGVQPRLEIRQLERNADQWNIYLLGLARFKAVNQSDMVSYFQIAGIHGRPYISWDNVQPNTSINSPGYCTHVSNLFLPWHRPYLALFEQLLYRHIVDAVNDFPAGSVRQRYAAAALSWRAPYWDWAATPPAGESVLPASLTSPTVTVTLPNGTSTIPNPLFQYNFNPVSEGDFYYQPFTFWKQTMRGPTSWYRNATSQNGLVAQTLDNNRVSFQDRLYNLFTNYDNFTEFSNEQWMVNSSVTNADSLESIHDAIHTITGSSGHMTYLDYAAFDPIFWLHHVMVDRCFAMWQAIYNDSYVEPMAAYEGTFAIPVGQVEDINSPLYPFHADASSGKYWTAASVRSTTTFGYTYADLGNGSVSAVKAAINGLYGNSAGSGGLSKRSSGAAHAIARELPGASSTNEAQAAPEEVANGEHREYLANIVSQKFALNGSYAIYVFMGPFDDTPSAWPLSPNLVGTHAVFATLSGNDAASDPQLKRRHTGSPIQVGGSMPLTSMLLAKVQAGELPCMDPGEVVPYLTENLSWRVGMFNASQVPVEEVADLMITVVSAEVEPSQSSDAFPQWGAFAELTSITQGKPGGC